MALGGKEDRELNLLLEGPDRRVGRRSFLRTAALLGAAGAAGYAGGTVAGLGRDDDGGRPAVAPAPAGPPLPGNRRNERLLNIYNWSDYIDDRTIPLFQALTNIRVNYDVYSPTRTCSPSCGPARPTTTSSSPPAGSSPPTGPSA